MRSGVVVVLARGEGPPTKSRGGPWQQEGQEGATSGNPASWMSGQLGWMTVMIFSGLKIYYCSF